MYGRLIHWPVRPRVCTMAAGCSRRVDDERSVEVAGLVSILDRNIPVAQNRSAVVYKRPSSTR